MTDSKKDKASSQEEEWFQSSSQNEPPPEPPRNRTWFWLLQIVLFGIALAIGLFPFLKSKYPGLERVFQPARYHQRLGHHNFQKNNYFEAIHQYKKALMAGDFFSALQGKERSATYFQIARCHVSLRQYGKAIRNAHKAIKVAPNWMQPYILVMDLHTQLHQTDHFTKFSKVLLKRFPSNWKVNIMMGNGYLRMQQYDKALASYNKAIETLQQQMAGMTPDASDFHKLQSQRDQLLKQLHNLKQSKSRQRPAPPIVTRRVGLIKPGIQRANQNLPTSRPTTRPALTSAQLDKQKPPPLPQTRIHRRSQRLMLVPFFEPRKRKSLDK